MGRAVFLDRDGVVNENVHLLHKKRDIKILAGVSEAIKILNDAGFLVIIVSNQPVVARGLIKEDYVIEINNEIARLIFKEGGGKIDRFYFCPHHPNANLKKYRKICKCRKPSPGMLKKAKGEFSLDMKKSYMVGDMPSDITAGNRAGCKTVLINSKNNYKIIETKMWFKKIEPDYIFNSLFEAVKFIVNVK